MRFTSKSCKSIACRHCGPTWHAWAMMLAAGLAAVPRAAGQEADPAQKQELRPRLVLNTLGPAGIARAVAFSNDSQRVFSAGTDKAVHIWQVDWDAQLVPQGPIRFQATDTLRWEIARATRGSINTLAVCPTREEIVVAGSSARDPYGDIVLFDTATGTVHTSLPTARNLRTGLPGHRTAVVRADYAPDGASLVSISEDGETIVWRPQDPLRKNWQPSVIRPAGAVFNWQRAMFISPTHIVVAEPVLPNALHQWRLAIYEVAPGPRRLGTLPIVHQGRVNALARAPDSFHWASSDATGAVYIWNGAQIKPPTRLRSDARAALCLAFGPQGQLAVGTEIGAGGQPSAVELWDIRTRRLVDRVGISSAEHCHACAVSPDGRLLVTQDVAQSELVSVRLQRIAGPPIQRPLSSQPATRVAGRGQSVRQVAFSLNEGSRYMVGFSSNERGPLTKAFDVDRTALFVPPPDDSAWIFASELNKAARVTVRGDPRTEVDVTVGSRRLTIRLDFDAQGAYKTHCLILGPQGDPVAIAVGTDTVFGIFVYSLPIAGGPAPRLLRYFRDHQDAVTCLSVSADGRYLASGSDDQMIKVWSLAGLLAEVPEFPNSTAWGADFPLENGRVTARILAPAGIAFGRGIRDGDVITKIETFDAQGDYVQSQAPAVVRRILGHNPIYRITRLHAQRNGQPLPLPLIMPAWEPMLTLFVENGGEWAIWHPEGYFDSSVAEGGDLFGWQVNQGPIVPPRLIKAAFMQKEFERPDVIQRLLQLGDLNAALAAAGEPVFNGYQEQLVNVIRQTPEVRILRPRANDLLLDNPGQAEGSVIEAEITWPPGVGQQQFEVRASIGGRKLDAPQAGPRQNDRQVLRWPIESYDLLNRIEVLVNERGNPAMNALYAADKVYVRGDRPQPTPYTLHTLVIAADAYRGGDGEEFKALKYSKADSQEIIARLKQKELGIGFYRMGEILFLTDGEISASRIKKEIQHLRTRIANPGKKEVVVVYIRGHGVASNGAYYFVPTNAVNQAHVESQGIPWSVFAQLAELPCHVIWLVDTCQSGQIADAKAIVREAQRLMSLIIMAVPGKEKQTEGELFIDGHTPFAYGLLSGLEGDADGYYLHTILGPLSEEDRKDSKINIHELTYYVKGIVNKETEGRIEPLSSPADLAETIQLPLLRVVPENRTSRLPR